MAQQGVFTLPANISFGVTGFSNSTLTETIEVLVDGEVRATFSGYGMYNQLEGSQVLNSGKGNVQIRVSVNGKQVDLLSIQNTLTNKLNFALVSSSDGEADADYNDSITVLNWPLG